MSATGACPPTSQYHRLIAGELSTGEAEALLGHLEGCEACGRQVASFADEDSLVELLRQSIPQADGLDSSGQDRLMQRLRSLAPSSLSFRCPGCHKALAVQPNLAGKKVKCPHCQQPMQLPAPVSPAGPITHSEKNSVREGGAIPSPRSRRTRTRT